MGEKLGEKEIDYRDGHTSHTFFLSPKLKYRQEFQEYRSLKRKNASQRIGRIGDVVLLLDEKKNFHLQYGINVKEDFHP